MSESSTSDSHPGNGIRQGHLADQRSDHAMEAIREAMHGLRFGSVLISVQDGTVVQIERTEKKRLARVPPRG